MDKYEYRIRTDEIKALIAQRDYAKAAEIADLIDWRAVKSVMMLCMISDLYKINKRYEDARDVLLLAYDRHPGGRSICYSLCELSIKMGEFVQAVEYYKEFVQAAPRDWERYVLQYKLYEAQDVSLEERIAVLEELKKREYREKWVYELAYLYHRVGQATRCVEVCDELILWFGEGKYVTKAMELKMLHEPLTLQQQSKYDYQMRKNAVSQSGEEGVAESQDYERQNDSSGEEDYSQEDYQQEAYLRGDSRREDFPEEDSQEGMQEDFYGDEAQDNADEASGENVPEYEGSGELTANEPTRIYGEDHVRQVEEGLAARKGPQESGDEEMDIQVKTMDVSPYNTINLQKELAEGLREVLAQEELAQKEAALKAEQEAAAQDGEEEISEEAPEEAEEAAEYEDFYEEAYADDQEYVETDEDGDVQEYAEPDENDYDGREYAEAGDEEDHQEYAEPDEGGYDDQEPAEPDESGYDDQESAEPDESGYDDQEYVEAEEFVEEESSIEGEPSYSTPESEMVGETGAEEVREETEALLNQAESSLPEELAEVLSMESDGQIRMVVSETEKVEKQLTGQLRIDEVLAEWERVKGRESEVIVDLDELAKDGKLTEEEFVEEQTGESEQILSGGVAETAAAAAAIKSETEWEDRADAEATAKGTEVARAESAEKAASENKETVKSAKTPDAVERDRAQARSMTREEKELFGNFLQNKSDRDMLVKALDAVSLAAYTGNVVVTGDEGMDTFSLARNVVKYIQMSDTNFSGKTAKISGESLNNEVVSAILERLRNGALIVQGAAGMNQETAAGLFKVLQQESLGIVVVLVDTKRAIHKFFAQNEKLAACFNARIELEALDDEALVTFGKKYAKEMEYSIDEMGVLALHTRVHDMQSSDHAVTIMDVRTIVDEAIRRANRKTVRHFCDVLLGKRYDDDDMIILREKDFAS